jgi:hypothetical protein
MKKLTVLLCLAFVLATVGCGLVKQSNRAHHAVEDKTNYEVDKVLVQVKDGRKTVIVHTVKKVPTEDHDVIKDVVLEVVPDAHEVRVVKASEGAEKQRE